MHIYTRKGDDGTTGLLFGGRVPKDAPRPTAYGTVDEAQAALGLARAECDARAASSTSCSSALERDLWVLMAELATDAATGTSSSRARASSPPMVDRARADDRRRCRALRAADGVRGAGPDAHRRRARRRPHGRAPGRARARRRGRRLARRAVPEPLSDLLWTLARWQEGASLTTKETRT